MGICNYIFMGLAEIDYLKGLLNIYSHIITYGNAADAVITERMREEIETMWNGPRGIITIKSRQFECRFSISAAYHPHIDPQEIFDNTDPRNNYFRIEEFALGNISFVDGLGSNSGYFKLENLYEGSTTAAHEYGHTLGLEHPLNLDLRGNGVPGIMYPRGTLVDPQFQYNPNGTAGDSNNGGTMHPKFRKVKQEDILSLKLQKLSFNNGKAIVGEFSSIWHEDHAQMRP